MVIHIDQYTWVIDRNCHQIPGLLLQNNPCAWLALQLPQSRAELMGEADWVATLAGMDRGSDACPGGQTSRNLADGGHLHIGHVGQNNQPAICIYTRLNPTGDTATETSGWIVIDGNL